MSRPVPKLKVAGVLILVLLVFFLAPVVPYVQPASLRGSSTSVWGFATPSYSLLGDGSPPYPPAKLVTVGDHSAIAYFDGGRLVSVEDAGPAGVSFDPREVVWVQTAQVTSFDFGFLNITVRVQNLGLTPIEGAIVYLSMYGFSANSTVGGLVLIQPKVVGSCPGQMSPGETCVVSQTTPNLLPANRSVNFYAEVRGSVNGGPFIYRQGFSEGYPTGGVGPLWVSAFMDRVDHARGALLSQNETLDQFAELRFDTASTHYQISDYGFANSSTEYFGPKWGAQVTEELLFPGAFSPDNFAVYLSEFAIGHWETLLEGTYTQFGYYVGHGPTFLAGVPCSIYEVDGSGVNIPQYFQSRGCTTSIVPSTWLVIVLSP